MESNWFFLPVVIGMLLLVSCVQAAPVTDGLVVCYDGSLSGNSLVDLSGNNNTGYATSVTQGTNQATGANYINLNGVNSKVYVSNNAQTNISSPVSIEFIGSINEFSKYGALVSKYNKVGLGWYLSSSSADPYNKTRFGAGTSCGFKNFESDGSLVAGQVCHIVATYDNNTTHLYVNGIDSGTRTWNLPIIGNPENITIGYGSGLNNNYCNCSMYTFRLYNRSLSSAEVLQNYNNDLWRYKATPTILWTNPADIIYGTALSSTQLNANASVPGSFVYTPASGTIFSAGTHTLHVDFTPTDTANYTNATADITINVSEKPVANLSEGELQLWTFNASEVSGVPNNIYTTAKSIPYTSNVSLKYNSTSGSIDSSCWHDDKGETYITGAFPTVNQSLTFTMGVDSNSQWSYGYMHTSVAYVGIRHASDGSYWVYSYWMNDTGSQLSSSYQIPATSVVNNKVTVSIHSYDSNRTNVIASGSTLYVTTPYTTRTTRNLPYPNIIQPIIYEDFWASGTGGWVNVHLYDITQSIPRSIITPYARNDIMGFGLDCPGVADNHLGTDFLISHNQSATVFVSGVGLNENDIEYNEYLFSNGFEEGIHFYPGLTSESLTDSKTIIDTQMEYLTSLFGAVPTSWSSHQNEDNVTHAIYAYQRYGALYRNGYHGMGEYIANALNLQNSTWYNWWNISSAHGAICPCFTHQTDIYPAPQYAIDPNLFETFVTNLNSNGIDLVSFSKWYYSSMAQTATTNVLESDANHIKFQLNTSGGYPVNMNVQTVISLSYLYCNGVSIPFEQTPDGIQFVSVGNGTYILTNTPLATPSITWSLGNKQKENKSIPGFGITCGVAFLLGVFLYKRK